MRNSQIWPSRTNDKLASIGAHHIPIYGFGHLSSGHLNARPAKQSELLRNYSVC